MTVLNYLAIFQLKQELENSRANVNVTIAHISEMHFPLLVKFSVLEERSSTNELTKKNI